MSTSISSMQESEGLYAYMAITKNTILAFRHCDVKLFIPSIMGTDDGEEDKYITLPMPLYLSITYGDKIIPAGTRVIVQAVDGNMSNLYITGFYDRPEQSFDWIDFIRQYIAPLPVEIEDGHYHEEPLSTLPSDYDITDYGEIK